LPPSHRTQTVSAAAAPAADPRPSVHHDRPVTEEAIFLEHRAALDATVLASRDGEELVFELDAGVLRPPR
jgi:hypothetical protein